MKTTCLLFTCLLTIAPAMADEATTSEAAPNASTLDLSLPSATGRNDPPGTWYGDTSGTSAKTNNLVRVSQGCPTSPDGEQNPVTGSVTMGMGHSRFGTSNFAATNLNYCKEYSNNNGNTRTINVNIDVSKSEGPDAFMRTRPHPADFPRW